MEYKADERPSLNGHGTVKRESPQHPAVPATLLPTVLSHLGLADASMVEGNQVFAALRNEKSQAKVAAIRTLGERREVSSLQFLVSALHDPAWEVRAAAVWALTSYGQYTPVKALIEALDDDDGTVRAAALRALSSVRGQIPPERLTHMLNDADWQVREAASFTEEELRELEALEALPLAFPSLPPTLQSVMQAEILGDRYLLQDSIGRGGMATIYRGRDMRVDRVVAIKVLREVYNTDAKFVTRFQREAKAASGLHHPNIVQVFDYGQTDGNYFIVMELVEGTDLRRYLRPRGILEVEKAIIIAHDVALGLGAAHRRGIVHRDVKPQNILVGRGGAIKLTDFGIASMYKYIDTFRLTTTGMTLGTVQYMPPEQAQGDIVSSATDVYALGIVMYEMLTGHTPFDGDTPAIVAMQHIQDAPVPPSQFNSHIPPALEEIILRCLEKVPERRYRDGSQLARALEALSDAEFSEAIPYPPASQTAQGRIAAQPTDSGHAPTQSEPLFTFAPPDRGSYDQNRATHSSESLVALQPPLSLEHNQSNVPAVGVPIGSSELSSIRPYAHGDILPKSRRNSRFTALVTVLILLATLLLMSFSLYLAVQLGFLSLPFFKNDVTPTVVSGTGIVPDLHGLTFAQANTRATQAGFTLALAAGSSRDGVVQSQSPVARATYARNSPILVTMITTTSVPTLKPGATLEEVEQQLQQAFLRYQVRSDGLDPTLPAANIVSRLDPASGTTVPVNTEVIIYVKNLNITPARSPTPSPRPSPSLSPSPTPSPSPSPSPGPSPTST